MRAVAITLIPLWTFDGTDVISMNYGDMAKVTLTGVVLSLLMSLAGSNFGSDKSDPSIIK